MVCIKSPREPSSAPQNHSLLSNPLQGERPITNWGHPHVAIQSKSSMRRFHSSWSNDHGQVVLSVFGSQKCTAQIDISHTHLPDILACFSNRGITYQHTIFRNRSGTNNPYLGTSASWLQIHTAYHVEYALWKQLCLAVCHFHSFQMITKINMCKSSATREKNTNMFYA